MKLVYVSEAKTLEELRTEFLQEIGRRIDAAKVDLGRATRHTPISVCNARITELRELSKFLQEVQLGKPD